MRGRRSRRLSRGVTLVETMVALGVLALVIPLTLAAMAKAGTEGSFSRAETRAPAIAEFCLQELDAARSGNSKFFDEIKAGQSFPGGGGIACLAIDRSAGIIAAVGLGDYQAGVDRLDGRDVAYLATAKGAPIGGDVTLMTVTVEVEYPAARKAEDRRKISFHTKLP